MAEHERFGLYTGQRLRDIAALIWANVDLVRNEIRVETRKTHKDLRVPIAAPLRRTFSRSHQWQLAPAGSSEGLRGSNIWPQETARLSKQFGKLLVRAGLRDSDRQSVGELPVPAGD
jgi:integrase